jgi:hypothetical protein
MAWTAPKTFVATEVLTASEMNTYVRDNTLALVGSNPIIVPSCRVYNNAAISIGNNSVQVLTFNSERWDTDEIHSTVTNTGRLTCQTAGLYNIFGHVQFAANTTGIRSVLIRLNGSTYLASQLNHQSSAAVAELSVNTIYSLSASDYVELMVYQNSGGALNVNAAANYSPEFGMTYLGKAA